MASFRKHGKVWYYRFVDADGEKVERKGCSDRRVTEDIARDKESEAARIRGGLDPKELGYRSHAAIPLSDHITAWAQSLEAKSATSKHVDLFTRRARRVVALIKGAKLAEIEPAKNANRAAIKKADVNLATWVGTARLADLTDERVQKALANLKAEGRSHQTCNHHRAAARAFARWCYDTHRAKANPLRTVKAYNVKEDRRHDRRTVSLDELHTLIQAADRGPRVFGISGPVRALCYRLAVATGLRYSEIGTIKPESFDWKAPSVTVAACYTKNGDPATLPLPSDLVNDLAALVAKIPVGDCVFPLPEEKGAEMLRVDLEAAEIDYQDASGLFFDFHSLRCQTATLADAAGVSPRVVQRLMRHSTLELTGRYTRPRAVDIEAAASMLPSLKPEGNRPDSVAATGTDGDVSHRLASEAIETPSRNACEIGAEGRHISDDLSHHFPTADPGSVRKHADTGAMAGLGIDSSEKRDTLENKGFGGRHRRLAGTVGTTGEATRTPDLRIMRPPL
jgi:integrase